MQVLLHARRLRVGLVERLGVGVRLLRRVHCRRSLFGHAGHELLLLQRRLLSVSILGGDGIVLLLSRFVDLGVAGSVESIWAHTVQLETDTSRTRPGVGSCSIAFNLSSAATLTSSHHCKRANVSVPAASRREGLESGGDGSRTLQPLVSVVFVYKDIVWGSSLARTGAVVAKE